MSPKWENEGKWIEDSEGRRRRMRRGGEPGVYHLVLKMGGAYFKSGLLGPYLKSPTEISDLLKL